MKNQNLILSQIAADTERHIKHNDLVPPGKRVKVKIAILPELKRGRNQKPVLLPDEQITEADWSRVCSIELFMAQRRILATLYHTKNEPIPVCEGGVDLIDKNTVLGLNARLKKNGLPFRIAPSNSGASGGWNVKKLRLYKISVCKV